jgi:hypothetical protein
LITSGFDLTSLLGTFVTPTIVVILILTGKLRTDADWKRIAAESDRKDEIITEQHTQLMAVQAAMMEKAIPALVRSSQVLEDVSSFFRTEVTIRRPHDDRP